jgi:hypothetical protein
MQTGDLIPSQHVEFLVHDAETERLIQTGREPLPANRLQGLVDPLHKPDFACHRRHSGGPIIEKIVSR